MVGKTIIKGSMTKKRKMLTTHILTEGLYPEVFVHPQGLELLGKGKVCEDHIMDLNRGKSVFNQLRPDLL